MAKGIITEDDRDVVEAQGATGVEVPCEEQAFGRFSAGTDLLQLETIEFPQEWSEKMLRRQLIEISDDIMDGDLMELKFLCHDIIPASKLQDTKSALDIFDFLEKRNLLTPKNADTLLECLWCMHRKDLIQKLGFEYPNRLEATILRLNTITPFRKLLLELYQAIDKKELRELHFFLKSKVKKSLVDKNLMEVFILLEQNKLLSPGFLIEMMKTVHRNDLITKIKCHIGGGTQPGNMEPMQQAKPVCQFRSATISQPMSGQQLGDDQNICNSIQQLSVTPDAMPPKMLDSQTGYEIKKVVRTVSQEETEKKSLKYGFPESKKQIVNFGYVASFNKEKKLSDITVYRLTREDIEGPGNRNESKFCPDPNIASKQQLDGSAFTQQRTRGHMVPAGDAKKSQRAIDETFKYTNIYPEYKNNKMLNAIEVYIRKNVLRSFKEVHIYTILAFLPNDSNIVSYSLVGDTNAAVPTHMFKFVIATPVKGETLVTGALKVPNRKDYGSEEMKKGNKSFESILNEATTDIKAIVEATGYDFEEMLKSKGYKYNEDLLKKCSFITVEELKYYEEEHINEKKGRKQNEKTNKKKKNQKESSAKNGPMDDVHQEQQSLDGLNETMIQNKEVKSMFQDNEDNLLLQDKEDKSMLQDNENKSMLQDKEDRSMLQDNDDKSMLQDIEDKSMIQDNEDNSLLQDKEDKSMLQDNENKSMLQDKEDRSMLQDNEDKSMLQDNEDKSMIQDNEEKSMLQDKEDKSSLQDNEVKSTF